MPNEHVEMLNKFQPFDPDFKEIYFESATSHLRIETKAFDTLKAALRDPGVRMVVLTGDAGHGKTHLCGLLLTELTDMEMSDAVDLLLNDDFGRRDLAKLGPSLSLSVIRDLSEKRPEAGGDYLRAAYERQGRVTVVCGNEGHLRACANAAGLEDLELLIDASVLKGHMRSDDGTIALVNLNHQSVVAEQEQQNIYGQAVEAWVSDDAKWDSCADCEHSQLCPILNNRERLNQSGEDGNKFRAQAVATLLRIAEQTGTTITIRQLLIYLAHLLTAGLQCEDVSELVDRNQGANEREWQWEYLFHHTAFGHRLDEGQRRRLEIFSGIRKLDPGNRAIRSVDDRLGDSDEAFTGTFPPPYKAAVPGKGAPTTKSQKEHQSKQHVRRWRAMRRFDFFEALAGSPGREVAQPSERVGLSYIESFHKVANDQATPEEMKDLRDRVVQGLEAIQGIHRSSKTGEMHIAHWAFLARDTKATVVGSSRRKSAIALLSQSEAWDKRSTTEVELISNHVDWTERRVILSLDGSDAPPESCIELMLHEFEFVLAAATGLRSEHFYAAQFRRIVNSLGRISPGEIDNESVVVYSELRPQQPYRFMIDGDQIDLVES